MEIDDAGKRREGDVERMRQEMENLRQASVWYQQQHMTSQHSLNQINAKMAELEKEKTDHENSLEKWKMDSAETKKSFNQALEVRHLVTTDMRLIWKGQMRAFLVSPSVRRPSVTPSLRRLPGASCAEYSALFLKKFLLCFFLKVPAARLTSGILSGRASLASSNDYAY